VGTGGRLRHHRNVFESFAGTGQQIRETGPPNWLPGGLRLGTLVLIRILRCCNLWNDSGRAYSRSGDRRGA
jgi:hypothetical protein